MHKIEAGSVIKELDLNYNEIRTEIITHDIEVKPENILLNGKGLLRIYSTNIIDMGDFMEDNELLVKGFNKNSFLIIKKESLQTA